MPDNHFELIAPKNVNNPDDNSTSAALSREVELLRDGIGKGVMHRLSSPEDMALSAGTAFVGAAALRMALDAGGKWGAAAKVVSAGFVALGVADVTRRAIPTADAMIDTWKSGQNLDENKLTVANNLGTALVDYPLMSVAGGAGFRFGRQTPTSFQFNDSALSPSPKTIFENGTPINPATRSLIDASAQMSPTTRAMLDSIPASGANTRALIEASTPINAATRAMVEANNAGRVSGIKTPEFDKAIFERGIGKGAFDSKMFDPAILNKSFAEMTFTEVTSSRIFPAFPVMPVDLMDKLEMVHAVQPLKAGLTGQSKDANMGATVRGAAEAAKQIIEIPPAPGAALPKMEMLQTREFAPMKLAPLPQAYFEMHEIQSKRLNTTEDLLKTLEKK